MSTVQAEPDERQEAEPQDDSNATPAPKIEAVSSLQATFCQLAQEQPRGAAYLRAAARCIMSHHRQVGYGAQGRCGADTISDFHCIEAFDDQEADDLQRAIKENLLVCQGEDGVMLSGPYSAGQHRVYLITIGVDSEPHDLRGAFCYAMAPATRHDLDLASARIQASFLQAVQQLPTAAPQPPSGQTDQAVEMVGRLSRYRTLQEFAFALVNSLARRFDSEQVAFGLRQHTHVKVLTISGQESLKANSPGVIEIQQAMEESLDAGRCVAASPYGSAGLPLHSQWAAATRSAVCSFPLKSDGQVVAVISVRRAPERGVGSEWIEEVQAALAPFGAAVELAQRGQQTLTQHATAATRNWASRALQPRTKEGAFARLLAVAATALFALGWAPYRPLTPCVVVPTELTRMLTPFDMQLEAVHARAGDSVQQGDLLATFETEQLELERSRLRSLQEQAEVDVRSALVRGSAGEASLAKASAEVLSSQLQAIEQKLRQCRIVAPAAGVVVQADLQDRIGQVLAKGEPILSFSPMRSFELEVRIPERQARHIQRGQSGVFVSSVDPNLALPYSIESVDGAARVVDGRNVIVARARLDQPSKEFRQGVAGYAKTNVGWKPLPWIAFHGLYEYARTNFWL